MLSAGWVRAECKYIAQWDQSSVQINSIDDNYRAIRADHVRKSRIVEQGVLVVFDGSLGTTLTAKTVKQVDHALFQITFNVTAQVQLSLLTGPGSNKPLTKFERELTTVGKARRQTLFKSHDQVFNPTRLPS